MTASDLRSFILLAIERAPSKTPARELKICIKRSQRVEQILELLLKRTVAPHHDRRTSPPHIFLSRALFIPHSRDLLKHCQEAEEEPVEGFTTPSRGQRPSYEATGTADPVSGRSLENWRRRQSSRDGLIEIHERPMSPGPLVNEGSGWEGYARSSALRKNTSRGGVEGDGTVIPTVHRAAAEDDTRSDDTSHGGSWRWMNSASRRASSRKSDDEHTTSGRMEVAVAEAAGTGECNVGERATSKPQEREFTSPLSGDDLTDSSSDHNGPITNWFPGLSWPRHPFRSHHRKGKGKSGGGKGADGKGQAGESRHGAKASTLARSPQTTAITAARQQTVASKSYSLDPIAVTVTGSDGPAISSGKGESFSIAPPVQVATESSHAEITGGPTNGQPSSVASMQCEIREAGVAVPAKSIQTAQPLSSSKRAAKGRGARPSALRPENGTSAVDTDRNGNRYTAVAAHTTESHIEQYSRMRLIIAGPSKQDDNGGAISLDGGHSEYDYPGDSAAGSNNPESSTSGFDSGFDAPIDDEAEKGSTTPGKGSAVGMAASSGRHLYSVGAARESTTVAGDKAQFLSRRKVRAGVKVATFFCCLFAVGCRFWCTLVPNISRFSAF